MRFRGGKDWRLVSIVSLSEIRSPLVEQGRKADD